MPFLEDEDGRRHEVAEDPEDSEDGHDHTLEPETQLLLDAVLHGLQIIFRDVDLGSNTAELIFHKPPLYKIDLPPALKLIFIERFYCSTLFSRFIAGHLHIFIPAANFVKHL